MGSSGFFQKLTKLGDLFALSIMYVVSCLPVITYGAATTALYYTTMKLAEDKESYIWKDYLNSFRQNFRQATVIWVIYFCACALVVADFILGGGIVQPQVASMVGIMAVVLGIFLVLVGLYVFPLLARFENTVPQMLKNSLLIAVRHFLSTVMIALIHAVPLLVAFVSVAVFIRAFLVMMLFLAGPLAYLESKVFVRVFYNYYPKTEKIEAGAS